MPRVQRSGDEKRYEKLFRSVELSKNFYYSPTYDLSCSLQRNMTRSHRQGCVCREVDWAGTHVRR
jgi:hypothetical protein